VACIIKKIGVAQIILGDLPLIILSYRTVRLPIFSSINTHPYPYLRCCSSKTWTLCYTPLIIWQSSIIKNNWWFYNFIYFIVYMRYYKILKLKTHYYLLNDARWQLLLKYKLINKYKVGIRSGMANPRPTLEIVAIREIYHTFAKQIWKIQNISITLNMQKK